MRKLYTFLLYLALPFIFLRLWWRSRRLPAYRQRWGERMGRYPFRLDKCIWVHAVSVGETVAALPLIKALKAQHPDIPLLVTTMTPTGAARVKSALGDSVLHAYIPYDYPFAVTRFLNAMHPMIGIIMETELWPNLLAACHDKNIPVCLLNARLSEKSARGYARIATMTREMLQNIAVIAAHGHMDAERFIKLGAQKNQVIVTGNIKFDLEVPADLAEKKVALRAALGLERFIWVAASTHAGEEEQILAAHKKLCETNPEALLILVPRHPDRFNEVAALCERMFVTLRRSAHHDRSAITSVYLCDTMGELMLMYSVADAAFVGGSLIERGGHNLLEPAALSKPILSGPYLFNFADIDQLLSSAHALIKVKDANALAENLLYLMGNSAERADMGQRALQVVEANRGALKKQLDIVSQYLHS